MFVRFTRRINNTFSDGFFLKNTNNTNIKYPNNPDLLQKTTVLFLQINSSYFFADKKEFDDVSLKNEFYENKNERI